MTEQELRTEFSRRLLRLAYQKGKYDQKELSEITGISETTISYYMNGMCLPKMGNIVKLAQALNCSTDELIMVDEPIE